MQRTRIYSKRFITAFILTTGICLISITLPPSTHAATVKWTVVDTPEGKHNVIVSPSEVSSFALGHDGQTFYAIDIPNGKVYRSVKGGIEWDEITGLLTTAGATMPAWHVALAPDNSNFVAIVTSAGGIPGNVFVSVDGGNSWKDTNCPANNISALDISPNKNGYDIIIGTRTGGGNGEIYAYRAVGIGNWASQGFVGDVLAAKFSTNYNTDSSLVVISTSATGTIINIGIHDPAANSTNWGTWGPVEVTTGGAGTSPTIAQAISADLELPLDFSGQVPSSRRFYISTDAMATNAGIYRFDDTVGYWLMPAQPTKRIASIAYYGTYSSGKLLAGEVTGNPNLAQVMTWFTDAPTTCPSVPCWYQSRKPPTGSAGVDGCAGSGYGNARVAWSPDGSTAYTATSSSAALVPGGNWSIPYLTGEDLDESAFSVSSNNGQHWNQLSLIDTEISFLSDVAASASSDTLYLASINNQTGCSGFDSMWRSYGRSPIRTWERVLCLNTSTNDVIVRMNPAEPQSVFFAVRSSADLFQSHDGGQAWQNIPPGVTVTDFAVSVKQGKLQLHVLSNNYVRRGESVAQAWQWTPKVDSHALSGHSIDVSLNGIITVGDAGAGMISFSADNGNQFTRIITAVPVPGNIHATSDPRVTNYIVIYAGSDSPGGGIYAWVVGASQYWVDMGAPQFSIYGLNQGGTLYGTWSSGTNSGINRTLNPEAIESNFVEWDNLTVGLPDGVIFTREPSSLKTSGSVDLWAIDNRPYTATTGRIWTFSDSFGVGPQIVTPPSRELLLAAPTLLAPEANSIIPFDEDKETVTDIQFRWRHPTQARKYDLWLAKDSKFSQLVTQQTIIPDSPLGPTWTLSHREIQLEPSMSYYWRIRVTRDATGENVEGQWSDTAYFTVASAPKKESTIPGPGLLTPANGDTKVNPNTQFTWQPVNGAQKYELTLSKDKELEQLVVRAIVSATTYRYDTGLEDGNTYFWQVKAIEPVESQPSPLFSFTVATEQPEQEEKAPVIPLTANILTWLWVAIPLLIVAIAIIWVVAARTRTYR